MELLINDIRIAARRLLNHKWFTVNVILILALGIGPNAAIFALFDALFWSRLPVPNPEQLFLVKEAGRSSDSAAFSYPEYQRLQGAILDSGMVAAMTPLTTLYVASEEKTPEATVCQLISGDFFTTLKLLPLDGRLISKTDDNPQTPFVAVISYRFMQRNFPESSKAVGSKILINKVPFTIIGVAPHDFTGTTLGRNVSVWIPLSVQQALGYKQHFTSRGGNPAAPFIWQENIAWLQIVGRINPEAKASSLLTSLNYIHRTSLHSTGEKVEAPDPLEIENGSRGFGSVRKRFSSPIFILMGAVGFVLLGTCANIATLMLVRGKSRSREISIRLSLGATHAQIARQFLTDSILLASAGGLLGGAASPAFGRLLLWASWDFLPRATSGRILNTHVLLYCAAIVILTTLIFATGPSLQSKTVSLTAGLRKDPVGSGYFGVTRSLPMWFTRFFVVLQIGVSFVLLAEGAVFLRSLTETDQTNVGFDKENTISVWFDPAAAGYTSEQMPGLYNRLSGALKGIPEVDSVAWSNCDIDSGCRNSSVIHFVAAPTVEGKVKKAQENRVSLDYFATLRIPLLDGRVFTSSDRIDSPRVAIVNKTFVRTYFEDGKAVGQRFGYDKVRNDDFQIVGVINDVAVNGLKEAIPPMIYYPISQSGEPAQMLALHAPITVTTKQVKEAIKQADNHLPITYVSRFSDLLDEDLTQDKGIMSLLSLFGILTVILSCLGTYGVISFLTKRRLPEFGVRLALGSSRERILMLAFRDVFMVASAGVLLGIGGFLITFRLTSHFMTELHLPAIGLLLNLVVLLTGLALLSGSIPAWRASRTDPLAILRDS